MSNTLQSYQNAPTGATSFEQTAQNTPQILPTADYRQHGATEYEGLIFDLLEDFAGSSDPVPAITEILTSWINSPTTRLDEAEQRGQLTTVLKLTGFLSQLRSLYAAYEVNTEIEGGLGHE